MPPAAVTSGSEAGHSAVGKGYRRPCLSTFAVPESPAALTTVTRFAAAIAYTSSKRAICVAVAPLKDCSVTAKLWLITEPGYDWIAIASPWNMLGNPWTPCVSAGFASTRTSFASGAIAWAHCTSRLVSNAQPAWMPCIAGLKDGVPVGWRIVRSGAGRPNVELKNCRSSRAVGLPYESTMTIVSPFPVMPAAWSASTPYAAAIWSGV